MLQCNIPARQEEAVCNICLIYHVQLHFGRIIPGEAPSRPPAYVTQFAANNYIDALADHA